MSDIKQDQLYFLLFDSYYENAKLLFVFITNFLKQIEIAIGCKST